MIPIIYSHTQTHFVVEWGAPHESVPSPCVNVHTTLSSTLVSALAQNMRTCSPAPPLTAQVSARSVTCSAPNRTRDSGTALSSSPNTTNAQLVGASTTYWNGVTPGVCWAGLGGASCNG